MTHALPSSQPTAARPKPAEFLAFAVLAALLAVAPLAIYPFFLATALCFALFAAAFNLLVGYSGLLSFGHALFFGGAAYVAAQAAKVWAWPPELALIAATAFAGALGLGVGALSIRRQGIYFSMITLALAQMGYFLALQAPLTHGEDGIQGVPRGKLLGLLPLSDDRAMYYFVLALFLAGLLAIHRIVHSPFGAALKAIRENESRAISLGYSVDAYKRVAFGLSAALAGLAGGAKALVTQSATLTDMHWTMSGEVILMVLLGGMGTMTGPVIGAIFVVAIPEVLNRIGGPNFSQWMTVIQGAIFVICVLAFRRGLIGELAARARRTL
ncbi:branched-chain amino acid transport system permease protein [Rhodoblastus acidophilus]|uniref:branched-chain amino acid ABC transporter permease n=1 Tax=Rhodoblastus acidophilus TaxID=1074 RepID=UPI00222570D0|nr:branched-chain amino acid ABC transporter permease [Rhodoblastus acidophilus]MCW2314637.1 branched-chain amino acid transport system permease protein [Rhodoblastus acidophilus]